ncbi:Dbv8 protein [Streptomyces albus]|uniref:Dbv8 protein n=1 Tax=Streptomyces albus (strain ATCC 21838 / DSM 41398 / FERM P-419 / JCM 4703 / NBRC 107858) TaxID=1081613 RepID=A0A0B5EI70_STRA4|nr:Dbv8 protein [Streptomyces albus]AOU75468.1 Dbv8 protein [Streptomyces albus]AYN31271.1 hypothetical protein DUI70_0768 [Streptomyces albus]
MELTAQSVAERLGMDRDDAWLRRLAETGPPARPPELPGPEEARVLLDRLRVAAEDREEILATLPAAAADPVLRWILDRAHQVLLDGMGEPSGQDTFPVLPDEHGAGARYYLVLLYLATLPATLRFHADRGIPEESSWETLGQLGEVLDIHRHKYGRGGVHVPGWLTLHLRGAIHRLGRLQFELSRWEGRPVLSVHIPAVGGPISAEACDSSFARARPFFAAHFPEHGAELAVCHSWLLDPQLAAYLPEESNVVRFMRRWELYAGQEEERDGSILEFVFRHTGQPLEQLPQRTSLERAAVAHLRAGGHWRAPSGWTRLP